jgi:hypothetical protein
MESKIFYFLFGLTFFTVEIITVKICFFYLPSITFFFSTKKNIIMIILIIYTDLLEYSKKEKLFSN